MKSNNIKSLQTIYNFQAGIGFLFTFFGTFLASVMLTGAPNSSESNIFIDGLLLFVLSFIITIGVPMAAYRELENFYLKKKLIYNSINIILMFFIFFPLALIQLYLLFKIYNSSPEQTEKTESIATCIESKTQSMVENIDEYTEQRIKEIDDSLHQYNKSTEKSI